jgi:hypothetical protein
MDPNLLAALIGLLGGLVGVAVGSWLQQRFGHFQMCRETTLQLYDRFDDPDILESRIRADQILAANAASPEPKSLSQLYSTLSREEWHHVSRTRFFLDQIGLLNRIGYLDKTLAGPLFARYVDYWVDRYFGPLEAMDEGSAAQTDCRMPPWQVTSTELKRLFSGTRQMNS